MIITGNTTWEEVMVRARGVESRCNARANLFQESQAKFILEYAPTARHLALSTGRRVSVWNCEAKPDAYRWSGWKYTRWKLVADPDGFTTLEMKRAKGPANSRSFNGVRFEVTGVNERSVLWRAGRQCERVLKWEPDLIQAARVIGATSFLLACLTFLT